VRAADVVAYILTRVGPIQQLRLQKLLYYCQAWRLAYDKPALFTDEIQAWAAGPVVPAVWRAHEYEYEIEAEPSGDAHALSFDQCNDVDAVLDRYGSYSGNQLSQLTHNEDPWKIAWDAGLPDGASERPITLESMSDYYRRVAHREANSDANGNVVAPPYVPRGALEAAIPA